MACDRHSDVDRVDRLIPVSHFKGHRLEVAVRICELTGFQTHVGGSCFYAGCFRSAAEGEVFRYIIKIRTRHSSVIAHAVFFTVIIRCIVRADDRHSHINRVNGLITVNHFEGHCLEVFVGICELVGRQAHVGGTGIRAGSCGFTTEGEITLFVKRIADIHIVAAYCMLSAIIVNCTIMSGDGNKHIDRVDRLITIGHNESDFREIVVLIAELFSSQAHFGRSGIRADS